MKKISILAMAALFLAACNTTDEQSLVEEQSSSALLFDAATNVPTTRATYGAINTNALMASADGFGVFAFHKRDEGSVSAPVAGTAANFMFNQQVRYTGSWTYSPLKYWPNETGTKAKSEDEETLSFLAYAPYTSANEASNNNTGNKGGIVGISPNTTDFDKIAIDYEVAQDPQKQVDLLWGVGDGTQYKDVEDNPIILTAGKPLVGLSKPNTSYKVPFLFKHALSKLNLNIDAIVDALNSKTNPVANGTKIFVRQVTLTGNIATKGRLMLKNTVENEPEWTAIEGTALAAAPLVLNDGREEDKEATTAKDDEKFACLNPMIIQKGNAFGTSEVGVTNATVSLLKPAEDGTASLMVIPVDDDDIEDMEVKIVYDVLTQDNNLGVNLVDGSTQYGSTVTNVITKTITGLKLEAGKEYTINMHLGMTSVKFDATVSEWGSGATKQVGLPENQQVYWTIGNDPTEYETDPKIVIPTIFYVKDAQSWKTAILDGTLAAYYDTYPTEAVAADDDPTIAAGGFVYVDNDGTGNKHTWHAEVLANKPDNSHNLPWIVVKVPAGCVGKMIMTYNGTDYTPWGDEWTFSKGFGVCVVSEFADLSPFTNYDDYVYGAELTGTTFDPTKLTVRLERTNVTSHTKVIQN